MCFLTFCRKETDSGRKKRMEGGREKKGKEGEKKAVCYISSSAMEWRRKWQPTPVSLPGKSHGQRILAGYSPWGCRVGHN